MSLADIPRVTLRFGPPPVHRLERLEEELGGRLELWAKREDCTSGLAYGGNNVRKLEYLAAEALAQGCDTLVSIGGVCVLVQEHWVDWGEPATTASATSCSCGS